jgi:L-ascorbate metabolism protein UlaG (beta-lactamase superfamily)
MGGATAALACRLFYKFRTIVPCHYGTFPMLDQTAEKFIREMGTDGGKVLVPEIGKQVEL